MDSLYYYTRVETMRYILENSNIYATNLKYMNDSEEYANGLKELSYIFNDRQKKTIISDADLKAELAKEITGYSISFSKANDLLSQWSMYAGESGVSIKMSFTGSERFKGYYAETGERKYLFAEETEAVAKAVYYCTKDVMKKQEYENVSNKIWKKLFEHSDAVTQKDVEGNYPELWKRMAPYVKRAEFKAEQEYRLVFEQNLCKIPIRIDYRNSEGVLKPYIDVECEGGWPVSEIVIGPGFNQEAVFNSVFHFLNHKRNLKIPRLTNASFRKRCLEYFTLWGEIAMPLEVKRIWDGNSSDFIKKNVDRYKLFLDIRSNILELQNLDENYKEQLKRRELSKDGIVLSRSRIPYIFEN